MDMLAADIGGTRSRFFRFSCNGGEISIKEGVVVPSVCDSFDALLEKIFACRPEDAMWSIFRQGKNKILYGE